jgi:hypothetical protein
MKVWIKLTKHFQGGSRTDYAYVDKTDIDTKSKQEDVMATWGEHSDGGHAYGYRVDMEELKEGELPPLEWLEKEIKRTEDSVERAKRSISEMNKLLIEYYLMKAKLI